MDRLVSMAVFKRAVDAGSFAAAARHFGISPEMVGNHVRGLERHLGVRLLNRSTRSPRGLLRIAVPVTFGVLHVAPAVSDYMTRYPEVRIDIVVSDRFVNLIEEGFEVAIRIGELQDSGLIARRLASARLVVCAAPSYLQRADRPETPADLSRHACLIYTETATPETWRFQAQDGRTETVHVSGPLTSTNPAFVRRMALAGHGVVRGPTFSLGADVAEGRLVPLLTGWRSHELSIHALYPHRSLLSAKVRSFVDFLAERFAVEPEWERSLRTSTAATR